jgi:cation diffusion facilitator CzcD-associated flavoprotein CzcO
MSVLPVESQTIVIGAGPAGLAVGACLKQANIQTIILEQSGKVGYAWHCHYDRLHLHTDKKHSELPFLSYPKEYPRYPSRTQVIEYLGSYAKKFQLDIRFHQQVVSAYFQSDKWYVRTQDTLYQTTNLVVAAGYNREPVHPQWPAHNLYQGAILHSSQYKNGEAFRGQRVLVVGFGNSGGEIAIDLWEHGAQPCIAVRSAVNIIPREIFGIPFLFLAIPEDKLSHLLADLINAPLLRLLIGDLSNYGLRKLPYGPMTQARNYAHIPLIDVGTIKLIKDGDLTVYPGIQEFAMDGVKFTDGQQAKFDAVILATGFCPRVNSFLKADSDIINQEGMPLQSGRETSMPGLYFCGYHVSPTGMLREIGIEAKRICKLIASSVTEGVMKND